jgi:hypothetical protein
MKKCTAPEHGDAVHEPVQAIPSRRSQAADGGVRRGRRQRDQSSQCDRSDQQIDTQDDLACHLEQIEMLVEDVERQMQESVARRRDPQCAPRQNDARIMQDALRRRDRQRDEQKPQGPVARLVDGLGHRPRAEIAGCGLVGDPDCRQDRSHEGDALHRRPAPGPFPQKWHCSGPLQPTAPNISAGRITPNHMTRAARSSPITISGARSRGGEAVECFGGELSCAAGEHPWATARSIG